MFASESQRKKPLPQWEEAFFFFTQNPMDGLLQLAPLGSDSQTRHGEQCEDGQARSRRLRDLDGG